MDPTGPSKRYSLPLNAEKQDETSESSKASEEFNNMVKMFKASIEEKFFKDSHDPNDYDFAPDIAAQYKDNVEEAARAYGFALGSVFLDQGTKAQANNIFLKAVKQYGCPMTAQKLLELRELLSPPQSPPSCQTSFSSSDDN
jgi:hypothetical protein